MKTLTKKEFMDRAEAIIKAKQIFIPHFTMNITIAFEIYNEMLAEEKHQLKLTTERTRDYGILSESQRPLCPECSTEMGLREINTPQGKQNLKGYKSSWICEKCLHEEYSTNTLQDWLKELKKRRPYNGL